MKITHRRVHERIVSRHTLWRGTGGDGRGGKGAVMILILRFIVSWAQVPARSANRRYACNFPNGMEERNGSARNSAYR